MDIVQITTGKGLREIINSMKNLSIYFYFNFHHEIKIEKSFLFFIILRLFYVWADGAAGCEVRVQAFFEYHVDGVLSHFFSGEVYTAYRHSLEHRRIIKSRDFDVFAYG